MRQVTVNVYTFDELNDAAKEAAREWYRSLSDNSDFVPVEEAIKEFAGMCGFVQGVDLFWSLGYSQSDYTHLVGIWESESVQLDKLKEVLGEVEGNSDQIYPRLIQVCEKFDAIAKAYPKARANIKGRGSVEDLDLCPDEELSSEDNFEKVRTDLRIACQSLNNWSYEYLRDDNDARMIDEYVDEVIRSVGYEFNGAGGIWE